MGFIDEIKARAKADKKTIVLPETEDERTYKAAEAVLKEGIADLILVGSKEEVEKNKGSYDISGAVIVDPATDERTEGYIAKLVELRQKKGMTEEQARDILLNNYLYYGVMMVKMGDADGMVSGACHSTADTLRPCLQILKTKPGTKLVSAFFLMVVPDKTGNQARIRFLPDGCSGLRYGCERHIYLRGFRTGAEPGSGEAGEHCHLFRRFLPGADRQRADRGHAFPLHKGKCKACGCR